VGLNEPGKTYSKDIEKPDGDACRKDGTLKDADELYWPDSPSDEIGLGLKNDIVSQSPPEIERLNGLQNVFMSVQIRFLLL
jgi:hypothetical protein